MLAAGGALVVVTPGADHLGGLVGQLGLLGVDERKQERLRGEPGAAPGAEWTQRSSPGRWSSTTPAPPTRR